MLRQPIGLNEDIEGGADWGAAVFRLRGEEAVDVGGDYFYDCVEYFLICTGSHKGAELRGEAEFVGDGGIRSGEQNAVGQTAELIGPVERAVIASHDSREMGDRLGSFTGEPPVVSPCECGRN